MTFSSILALRTDHGVWYCIVFSANLRSKQAPRIKKIGTASEMPDFYFQGPLIVNVGSGVDGCESDLSLLLTDVNEGAWS